MGHENLYGNVERVFRSGPDSIYLYTNTILNIHLQSSDRTYMATAATCLLYFEGGEWASDVGMWQSSPSTIRFSRVFDNFQL